MRVTKLTGVLASGLFLTGCASVSISPAPVESEALGQVQYLATTKHFSNDPSRAEARMKSAAAKHCANENTGAPVANESYGLMGNWFMLFSCQ